MDTWAIHFELAALWRRWLAVGVRGGGRRRAMACDGRRGAGQSGAALPRVRRGFHHRARDGGLAPGDWAGVVSAVGEAGPGRAVRCFAAARRAERMWRHERGG